MGGPEIPAPRRKSLLDHLLAQELPGRDDGVGVQGHRVDALVHEPLSQVRVVRRALAADADVFALGLGGFDQSLQTLHDSWIPFVEVLCNQAGITVQAQRQLRKVVAADGKPIEVLQELLGQEDVARQLGHHVHLQPVLTSLQAVLLQDLVDIFGHVQGAHERDHDLHILQAHLTAHNLHGLQLHGEALLEEGVSVPPAATEANHGILLIRLVLLSSDQALVLVGLEVGQAHNDALGVHGGSQGGHTLSNLVDVELLRAAVAPHSLIDQGFRLGIQSVVVQEGLGVHADGVVDDELETGQANALVGELTEAEGRLRIANVHHDLQAYLGKLTQVLNVLLELQLTLVDVPGVALGTGHSDGVALLDLVRSISATDDGRDAKLPGNDGCMAGAPTAVRDDGAGLLHDGFPVRVSHVCHQDLTLVELGHLVDAGQDVHLATADSLAHSTALCDGLAALLQHLVLLNDAHLLLRGNCLRTSLHDV
mmetsp:Transcript_5226/g.12433  ORF Transcript_5226/g.12433 Transcript_5226/m.12433 type:complete len:481 (+) Transcript_5226:192-1634(+)